MDKKLANSYRKKYMKRWFCGFSSQIDSSFANLPKPLNGEMLWDGANPFWVCGSWGKPQIITIFEESVRLAIVGTCLAPYKTLIELFQNAVKKHDYSRLMRLPGSYNLIVQDKTDTYVFVDVAGLRPVFYTEYDSCIAYSSLGVTLQQLIKAEVDLCWLANSLVGITAQNLVQNRSPFSNVQTIPPGHYLQISSGKPTCKRYWNAPSEYTSFFDTLVIDACLSAKPEERTNPSTYKPLLSKALEQDLPKSIFTRTTKGDYTAGEFAGLQKNLPKINELFQTSLLADMDLINIRELRDYMQQLGMGIIAGSFHFHQTLAIELWLRRVVNAKNYFWEHSTEKIYNTP